MRFIGASYQRSCGYYWPAKDAKAVIILVHGQGSYLIFDYLKPHVSIISAALSFLM